MPTERRSTIRGELSAAQTAIGNTRIFPEVQTKVGVYGYSADKLQEGQQIYDTAYDAVNARAAALREQRYATSQTQKAKKAAQANYQKVAQMARLAFAPTSEEYRELGLVGGMPDSADKFLTAAMKLFNNALTMPEIVTGLARFGFNATRLESERAAIFAFEQARENQAAAVEAAKQATRRQQEALAALHQWLAQYRVIARIALEDKPWLLKMVVGKPRSSRKPARKSATQETTTQKTTTTRTRATKKTRRKRA